MAIKDKMKEIIIPKIAVIVPAPKPGPIYNEKLFDVRNNSTFYFFSLNEWTHKTPCLFLQRHNFLLNKPSHSFASMFPLNHHLLP